MTDVADRPIDVALAAAAARLESLNGAVAALTAAVPHTAAPNLDRLAASTHDACLYGPPVAALDPAETAGLILHQYLHVALGHARRAAEIARKHGPTVAGLFNDACDIAINAGIADLAHQTDGGIALPRGAVTGTAVAAIYGPYALARSRFAVRHGIVDFDALARADIVTIFGALRDLSDSSPEIADPDLIMEIAACRWTCDLLPGAAPDPTTTGANDDPTVVARHLATALGSGDDWSIAEWLARRPTCDGAWRRRLRAELMAVAATDKVANWGRPSRRMPCYEDIASFMPAMVDRPTPAICAIVDAEAALAPGLLGEFRNELAAIARISGVKIDERMSGSDLAASLAAADLARPTLILCLTDLCGPAPTRRTRAPLLWCVDGGGAGPFGRTINIDPTA
jgi:hypothetical protein